MGEEPDTDLHDARKVLEETHQYLRKNMTLWVQWFTFFITVNYVGIGWFASGIRDMKPLHYVAFLLISQCILGIWVSMVLRKWFLDSEKHLADQYRALPSPLSLPPSSAHFYATAIALACIALATLIIGWGFLAFRP